MFACMCIVSGLVFFGAYLYCLFADRDALRSETYSIQKLAIEKGFIGDSIIGILDSTNARHALEQTATRGEEKK